MKKRILSMLLCVILTLSPTTGFAQELMDITIDISNQVDNNDLKICENHKTHDETCEYVQEEAECTHECQLCEIIEEVDCTCPNLDTDEINHNEDCPLYKGQEQPTQEQIDTTKNMIATMDESRSVDAITITINDDTTEYSRGSLQDAIDAAKGNPSPDYTAIKKLTIIAGKVTGEDWYYIKNLEKLTDFTILDHADVKDAPDIPSFSFPKSIETVSIPQKIKIGNSAFYLCKGLTTANFPQATNIGDSAFYDCKELTIANFPQATNIGKFAFVGCTGLTTANFLLAENIGDYAFFDCAKLTAADFPLATNIGDYAFSGCTGLTTADIPNATNIGDNAFAICNNLATLKLGETVPSVGKNAFHGTADIRTLELVDEKGKTLKGKTLNTVRTLYKGDVGGKLRDEFWYDWKLPAEVSLTSIEVTTQPTRANYTVGETFEKTDMVVKATYSDNSASEITNYTFSPNEPLTTNNNKITISYTEEGIIKTTSVDITVKENSIVDKTALIFTIFGANEIKYEISENNNVPSSVKSGTKYVTETEMKAFKDVIEEAQNVANNSDSTMQQVSEVITKLNNAITEFETAIKTGTYISGGGSSSTEGAKPSEPVTEEIQTEVVIDKNGNATVDITNENIEGAIKAALSAANNNGTNNGEITAIINIKSPANSNPNKVLINMSNTMFKQIISSKISNIIIAIDKFVIDMNLATIIEINKQASSDIQFLVKRTDASKLSAEGKNAIGNRPVYDLKITYENGAKSITNFGEGQVKLEIPYTLQKGEIASEVYAVYVDENGKANTVENSKYDEKTKTLKLSTNHFSIFGVGYKTSEIFLDIKDHWSKANIEYIVNSGLMTGISQTSFAPENQMTREVFVTALGKLAKIDTNNYQSGKFVDVEEKTSYAPYINWAVEKGIVVGTSDTTFSPNKAITRQEMAVIMSGYAKALNYEILETKETVIFSDNNQIEMWAAPSVNQMQKAGVLNGKDNNIFDPLGTATRGEVCAMLLSYIEFVVESND